jgi:hypothetical protein
MSGGQLARSTSGWSPAAPTATQTTLDVHDTPFRNVGPTPAGCETLGMVQRERSRSAISSDTRPLRAATLPTVAQTSSEGHDSASGKVDVAPAGIGIVARLQRDAAPVAEKALTRPRASEEDPSTVHRASDPHHTAASAACAAGEIRGGGAIDQRLPFHRSRRGDRAHDPPKRQAAPTSYDPTATQVVADRHETPPSEAFTQAARVARRETSHWPPLQRIAIGVVVTQQNEYSASDPTAMHMRLEGHDTPTRLPSVPVSTIDHVRPAQCSIRVRFAELSEPTATHDRVAGHETPLSVPLSPGRGFGDGCRDHDRPSHRSTRV